MSLTQSQKEILANHWSYRYNLPSVYGDNYDALSNNGQKAYYIFKAVLKYAGHIIKEDVSKIKAEVILEPRIANKIKLDNSQHLIMKKINEKTFFTVLKRGSKKNNELFVSFIMYT